MTQKDWSLYFSALAASHVSLLHSASDKHFFRCELQEFFADLRNRVNFPALIFESSLLDIDGDAFGRQLRRTLAFIVVKTHRRDDWGDIEDALEDCEVIGTELVGRLNADIVSQAAPFSGSVSLLDVHAEPVANIPAKYVGWRFELVVSEAVCLHNPNAWRAHEEG